MTKKQQRESASPFSIRFTKSEKAILQAKAAGMPLGIFIRNVVLDENVEARSVKQQFPVKDREALGRVLALLGQTKLANNLNQLAKHANAGTLFFDEETKADLHRASEELRRIRAELMQALGKEVPNDEDGRKALLRIFRLAAEGAEP